MTILDADGDIAAHTGERCIAEAGHVGGEHYSVQANLLERDTVPQAMARAFETTDGDLAERLMAALEAAQAEGGTSAASSRRRSWWRDRRTRGAPGTISSST